jgi:hypothetical protein
VKFRDPIEDIAPAPVYNVNKENDISNFDKEKKFASSLS